MSLSICPKGYRVVVKPDELQESYGEAGIVIVEDRNVAQAAVNLGTVVAIGNLAWKGYKEGDGEPWAEVGQKVYFSQYAGKKLLDPVTEEEYLIMNDEDILGTVTEKVA